MARSFNGSTQFGSASGAVVAAVPLTLAAWINPTSFAGTHQAVLAISSTVAVNLFWLETSTSGVVQAQSEAAGTAAHASTTAKATLNTWQHVAAVFTSATSRAAYLNGGNKGTNATSNTPGAVNVTSIGALFGGSATPVDFFPGAAAEACIWSAALSDAEIAALALGVRPSRVRPAFIVGYWPLWGLNSPEPDYSGFGNNLALTASPAAANHAPVTTFTRKAPALAYPPYLAPVSGGIPGIFQPGIAHGGRM